MSRFSFRRRMDVTEAEWMICVWCSERVAPQDRYARRFALSGGRAIHVHQRCYRLALAEPAHQLDPGADPETRPSLRVDRASLRRVVRGGGDPTEGKEE